MYVYAFPGPPCKKQKTDKGKGKMKRTETYEGNHYVVHGVNVLVTVSHRYINYFEETINFTSC